jgi:RNA polymerase sigma-70 factor (ECF subfamily)
VSIDESQLVTLAQKGDVASLERLLEDHYDYIFSICRKVIGNTEDANEATQEALISIVKNINSFKFSSKFSTWLYRIATNAALDEIRKKSRRPTTEFNEETVTTERKSSLEDEVIDRIDVTTALQALPEEFRIVLVLRDQLGNSYDDIGELLGVPAGTVKSRIARARQKIKEELLGNKIHSQGVKEVNDG